MIYNHVISFVLNKPKVVYFTLILAIIASLLALPNIKIDTDPENMLSVDAPARVFHNQTKQDFAMRDMIVVGAVSKTNIFTPDALQVLHQVSDDISNIDGVIKKDLLSLNEVDNIYQSENNTIRFEYLMKQAPTTLAQSKAIENSIARLPLLNNTLVSDDSKAIAIYVPIVAKDQSYIIAEQIRALISKHQTSDSALEFHITGLPVAEDQFGYEMFVQMGIAAPMAGAAIFFLLWYFFRNFKLIIAPMIVAISTVIIIMAALIGMGFTVHIMSSMIAIFLMPIAVVDSVHVLSEFSERYKSGDNANNTIKKVMSHLFTPMLYTSLTSAIGFYSLILTPIPPVKVFGAFIGTGILLAFLLTITFLPAYISRLKPQTLDKLQAAIRKMEQKGKLALILEKIGLFSVTKTKVILVSFIAFFIISVVGITRIEINDNPINWFKSDHQIRIADKALNNHFAGTYDAWLVFSAENNQNQAALEEFEQVFSQATTEGLIAPAITKQLQLSHENNQQAFFNQALLFNLDDLSFSEADKLQSALAQLYSIADNAYRQQQLFQQPQVLQWLVELQKQLLASELVGKSNGLTDIVRTVNRELHSGQAADFTIPDSANGVAQTLLQYQSSHRPDDLWHFVSPDYQKSLLWLQMTSGDNQHTSKVVAWVDNYIKENPAPVALKVDWAGKSYLNIVWQDAMVSGMIDSLLSSFVIVFAMMVLLFRSVKYGVLAMLPLTFTITMIYGLIGWFGKAYDMPIAVLSALTLGLSIDFAIHFLQRTRELEQQTGSLSAALLAMFQEPSRAIARNAIVIAIGFTPLLLSPLMPYITVGFFLASIMALSAAVTLVLLPSLLTLWQSKQHNAS